MAAKKLVYTTGMTIQNINVEESIAKVKKLLEEEKTSPAMKSAVKMILLLVEILINSLNLNSTNSSKPPSTDPNYVKKPRKKSNKKPGGQQGHKGKTLRQIDAPDEIEEISVDRDTLPKGQYKSAGFEKRQVFDIDIQVIVTEYRAEILENEKGDKFTAIFPEGVKSAAQYGDGVKAQAVYLSQRQLLPMKRIEEYFADQMGLPISAGSIHNFNQEASGLLETFEKSLKQKLGKSSLLHADETGINIGGEGHWLHCNSNEEWTLLAAHKKRGCEAMDEMGVLPNYHGKLCHDHWKPYFRYKEIEHALCNAHHLRELNRAWEQDKQKWAKQLGELLLKINEATRAAGGVVTLSEQKKWRTKYRKEIKAGEEECPEPELPKEGKKRRGRLKRSKTRNLLERLRDYEEETLRFMTDREVPFTNNLGERDIRMTKLQQKISGCFRSMMGARAFCRINSYISSARKQNISATHALHQLFSDKHVFVDLLAE